MLQRKLHTDSVITSHAAQVSLQHSLWKENHESVLTAARVM